MPKNRKKFNSGCDLISIPSHMQLALVNFFSGYAPDKLLHHTILITNALSTEIIGDGACDLVPI